MCDSAAPNDSGVPRKRFREQHIEAIKRWVAYIKSEPPETWGPQQNAVVDDQLVAAQDVGVSATHQQAVSELADEIARTRDDDDQ